MLVTAVSEAVERYDEAAILLEVPSGYQVLILSPEGYDYVGGLTFEGYTLPKESDCMSGKEEYTDAQREEYEKGQKEGSQTSALGKILGPGFVSKEYQAGFENGADNRDNDNWINSSDDD